MAEFSRGSPDVVVHCTDAAQMVKAVATVGQQMGKPLPIKLEGVLRPGSPFSFAMWMETKQARMKMETEVPLELLVGGMLKGAEIVSQEASPAGSVIHTRRDSGMQTWRRVGDGIEMMDDGIDLSAPGWDMAPLAAVGGRFLAQPGCSVLVDGAKIPKKPTPDAHILLHIPFDTAQGVFFAMTSPEIAKLKSSPAPSLTAPDLRTMTPQDALMVLGVGLNDLDLSEVLEGAERRKWNRLRRRLPVDGLIVGMSRSAGRLAISAAVPMDRPIGAAGLMCRLRSVLNRTEVEYEKVSATELRIESPGGVLLVTAQRGRLLVSTDAAQISAMESGRGEPWLTGRAAELAAEYPFLLTSNVLPGKDKQVTALPSPITLAVGLTDGVMHGFLVLPVGLPALIESIKEGRRSLPVPGQ